MAIKYPPTGKATSRNVRINDGSPGVARSTINCPTHAASTPTDRRHRPSNSSARPPENVIQPTDSTPTAWNGYAIGADRPAPTFGGSRAWEGDIAELIFYDEALSDYDRRGVEMYLNDKWGLGITPYSEGTFNPNVYALGLEPVPEPSALALIALGGSLLLLRKRGRGGVRK